MPDVNKLWRWARKKGTFYYAVDNLPARIRKQAEEYARTYYPQQNSLKSELESYVNNHYGDYYALYADEGGVRARRLSEAAAVLVWAAEHFPKRGRKAFLEEIVKLRYDYIPRTWHTLYKKVRAYLEGYPVDELIRYPRPGNTNALRYTDTEVESWIIQLRNSGRNYTNAYIVRKITELCRLNGKAAPSERWIENYLSKHEVKQLTAAGRWGSGRLANRYQAYVPVKRPMFAGDVWQIDATRLNLIEHTAQDGKKRHLFLIAVRDMYSGDVLGYHFDYKEDRWSVLNAVKMAVMEAGYLPYQMVFDRFPGHNTPEAEEFFDNLRALGVKVTFTHKATGKASLERWFATLQTVFLQDSDYYYGEGIQSRRYYAHRSPEYLARLRKRANKEGWNLTAAVEEGIRLVEKYRNTPYAAYSRKYAQIDQSPKELHEASEKPNTRPVTREILYGLFAYKKEVSIKRGGIIRTEIYKQELYYQITDYEVVKRYPKVWIAYMPDDLDSVELFVRRGPLWLSIGHADILEPVEMYGPQARMNGLGKLKKALADMEAQRQAELDQIISQGSEVEFLLGRYAQKSDLNEAEASLMISGDSTEIKPVKNKKRPPDLNTGDAFLSQL